MRKTKEKTVARATLNIKVQERKESDSTTEGTNGQVRNFCKSAFVGKKGPWEATVSDCWEQKRRTGRM